MNQNIQTIDEYISIQPTEIKQILEQVRLTIREAAPEVEETISYQMPAFKLHGMLVYFAAWKKHIGFYPTGSGITAFKEELSKYKGAKGSVQFSYDKPIPYALIKKMVQFRVKENLNNFKKKSLKN